MGERPQVEGDRFDSPAIAVVVHPDDLPTVGPLVARLEADGVNVDIVWPLERITRFTLLAVTPRLTEHNLESAPTRDAFVGSVPVLLEGEIPEFLAHLSHLILGDGVDRLAGQIRLLASADPSVIARWNALVARAQTWKLQNGPVLSIDDCIEARRLLTRPIASVDRDGASTLREAVDAGARVHRRSIRRLTVAATVIVLVLIGTAVAANVQRGKAAAASADARLATDESVANRLALAGAQLVFRDPDLPWLLLERAIALDPSPNLVPTAAHVMESSLPHRTVDLPGRPGAVFATEDRVFVSATSGGIEVYDRAGQHEASIPGDLTSLATSSQGDVVGVVDGQLVVIETGDGAVIRDVFATTAEQVVWLGDDRLAYSSGAGVLGLDPGTGKTWPIDEDAGVVSALAALPDEGAAIVVRDRNVAVRATEDGALVTEFALEVDGIDRVVVGTEAVIFAGPLGTEVMPRKRLSGGEDDKAGRVVEAALTALAPASPGWAAIGNKDGRILIAHADTLSTFTEIAGHNGAVTSIARLDEATVVSVGTDERLRIWDVSRFGATMSSSRAVFGDAYQVPGFEESKRAMLATNGSRGLLTFTSNQTIATFDTESLELGEPQFVRGLFPLLRPLPDATRFFYSAGSQGQAGIIAADYSSADLVESPVINHALGLHTAVDESGRLFALASRSQLLVWDPSREIWDTIPLSGGAQPVALLADGDRSVQLIMADGSIIDGTGSERSVGDPEGAPIAAAALSPEGDLTIIDEAGALKEASEQGVSALATLDDPVEPVALRWSPSAGHLAVIGLDRSLVLNTTSWTVVYAFDTTEDGVLGRVDDIAFSDDEGEILLVYADGRLQRRPLLEPQQLLSWFQALAPRELTDDERKAVGL